MEPVKSTRKVDRMFAAGQPFLIDPASGYKYNLCAACPGDGSFAAPDRIEKKNGELSRVVFSCPTCFKRFEVPRREMLVG